MGDDPRDDVNGGKPDRVFSITADHHPRDAVERSRIASCQGFANAATGRVQVPGEGRDDSGLAMTRALGDLTLHKFGIIHKPGYKKISLQAEDGHHQCVLCCSDGVWEFLGSDEASELIAKEGPDNVLKSTFELGEEAHRKWSQEEEETDDVSAVVIWI